MRFTKRVALVLALALIAGGMAGGQAVPGSPAALSGRVMGRILGWPAALRPPAGERQALFLFGTGWDTPGAPRRIALVVYRFSQESDRLPAAFFDPMKIQSLAAAPSAGCGGVLSGIVALRGVNPATGAATARITLARLRGVPAHEIGDHLDEVAACYLLAPGGIVTPGAPGAAAASGAAQ